MRVMLFCFWISMFLIFGSVFSNVDVPRALPEAFDDFESIRVNNRVYVDKSAYIKLLLGRRVKCMRICRPQNFGKSNFVQMLHSFFSGNKMLLEGLDICANQSWKFSYPVLHFDFTRMNVTNAHALGLDLSRAIVRMANSSGFDVSETDAVTDQLRELISGFGKIRRRPHHLVVILIDEYDWPVRRHEDNCDATMARELGDFLQDIFGAIQSERDNLRFLFTTCTTPLDLEYYADGDGLDLVDITHDAEFDQMIGLTHDELLSNFKPHIERMADGDEQTFLTIVDKIKKHYRGFCFSTSYNSSCQGLYNFHSVLSCLRGKKVSNFWHATKDAKYNVIRSHPDDAFRRRPIKYFSNITIPRSALENLNHADQPVSMVICMVLYGYLTFRGYDVPTRQFRVGFPNDEVREKFLKEVVQGLPLERLPAANVTDKCRILKASMLSGKWRAFVNLLNCAAFGAKFVDGVGASEYEYTDRVIRVLQACDIDSRYRYDFYHNNYSLAGTIDLVAENPDENLHSYVFEFELNQGAGHAMDRLLNFAKVQKFVADMWSRKIHLLAINFAAQDGTINEWIGITFLHGRCTDIQSSNTHHVNKYSKIAHCDA